MAFTADDLPPLYVNEASDGKKPKWVLVEGVGPTSFELDRLGSIIIIIITLFVVVSLFVCFHKKKIKKKWQLKFLNI